MKKLHSMVGGIMLAGTVGVLAACAGESSTVSGPSEATAQATEQAIGVVPLAGSVRLRCERRSNRSKISVDGRNLSPRGGIFRARVRAAGGTATSGTRRAVGDEVEFDFDSNRNDVREGATRIPASFIAARSGPDVVGEILNARGQVVASQGADCESR